MVESRESNVAEADVPEVPHGSARLSLTITTDSGQQVYVLRRLDGGGWRLSRDGKVYDVSGDGRCTCRDAVCRKQCKHVRALRAVGVID